MKTVRVTSESKIAEVLARCPAAGPIFFQHGRLYRAQPRDLYAQYPPDLSVGEYAAAAGLDVALLLHQLDAAVEGAAGARPRAEPAGGDHAEPRSESLTIGYTGSYSERVAGVEGVPAVAALAAKGPD